MKGDTRSSLILSHTHISTLHVTHFTNLCEDVCVYGGVCLLVARAVVTVSVQDVLRHHLFWTTYSTILATT